jgi:hypothetical protein
MAEAFSQLIQARCQPGFASLVDRAAQARGMSHSEYVRQAARTALQLDGYDPAAIAPRDAGALYDSVEGLQRYALATPAGDVLAMSYLEAKPEPGPDDRGGAWLPVSHEDSEPFDPVTQWRLAPIVRVDPDRVVVTYPVIAKSLEAM